MWNLHLVLVIHTTRAVYNYYCQVRLIELVTLRPPHTRDWEHVIITLQALSLVEKAELVQLRSRDQRSIYVNARWMYSRTNTHNCQFILFIMREDPHEYKTHWNSNLLRAPSHMPSHSTLRLRDQKTWLWRWYGTAFKHFLLCSHNFTVTALCSCVEWQNTKYKSSSVGRGS